MAKRNISATIDEELLESLDRLAEKTERKKSWLLSKAIELLLETYPDLQWHEVPGKTVKNANRISQRLKESERLYEESKELNPYAIKPLARSFDSFEEYERWRREQEDPWYR